MKIYKYLSILYSLIIIIIIYFVYVYLTNDKNKLSINEAKNKIKTREINKVIDVRTIEEYNKGHYRNSIHIPLQSFRKDLFELQNIDKKSKILVYCRTGRRAKEATQLLNEYGFSNVYYIEDNYKALE